MQEAQIQNFTCENLVFMDEENWDEFVTAVFFMMGSKRGWLKYPYMAKLFAAFTNTAGSN